MSDPYNFDPSCQACRLGMGRQLSEYDRNVLHDLSAVGVKDEMLRRVADYIYIVAKSRD